MRKHILIKFLQCWGNPYVFLANSLLYGKIELDTQAHPTTLTLWRMHAEG